MSTFSRILALIAVGFICSPVYSDDTPSPGMPIGSGVTNGRGLYLRPVCFKPGEKQGCAEMCFRRFIPTTEKLIHVRGMPFQIAGMDTEYWNDADLEQYKIREEGFKTQNSRTRSGRVWADQCHGPKLSGAAWAQVFACNEIDRDWREIMELSLKQDENWILWEKAALLKRKTYRKFSEYIGGDGTEFYYDLRRCGILKER